MLTSVCLFVFCLSQNVLHRFSCTFVEGLAIHQRPTHYILVEFAWELDEFFIKICVAEMNEKMLDCAHYPYIIQVFNIHKQAEFTENNG